MTIQIKRVYDPPARKDGYRVLVDRIWPRGLTKERADIDLWLKDIAPSSALRSWFTMIRRSGMNLRYATSGNWNNSLIRSIN